jgi:predicted RecB family nuclease
VKAQTNWPLHCLPGLPPQAQTQLSSLNIETTFDLLRVGHTMAKRQKLAQHLSMHIQHVNKWVALADLARIPSVGCQYCGLLLHAGVSSPRQLSEISIARLHQQVKRLHIQLLSDISQCPSLEDVHQWIEQAKRL